MLRTVKLYGHLGKTFPKEWRLDVRTPAEAIKAISVNCPGFLAYLEKHSDPGYRVLVGEISLDKNELSHPSGTAEIKIIPVVVGSGEKDVFNIIVGALLVAAAVFVPGLSPYAAKFIGGMGASMMLSGVSGLLAPNLNTDREERPENKPSYAFNGPVNTIGQGNPVPILYGRLIVGGQVISAGLSVDGI